MRYILCILVVLGFGCGTKAQDGFQSDRVKEFRKEKNRAFIEETWSPLVIDDRMSFKGLSYFPISATWYVKARFVPAEHVDTVLMSTSKDELRPAIRPGKFVFTIAGKEQTLWAFQLIEPTASSEYFVPFKDVTNGAESYELGRYVEVPMPIKGVSMIDFNMAYNPFCAYNYDYSCPLVPYYNTLSVPVTAGEKSWH